MRTSVLLPCLLAGALAAGCGVDATKLQCQSSLECPTGYHCDLKNASGGLAHCANGGGAKTLTADASKVSLLRQPGADGAVRSTLSGQAGAVASPDNLFEVSVVVTAGTATIATIPVAADGSFPQTELPGAPMQVSLAAKDNRGSSVAIAGYAQHSVVSFLGKDVPGSTNGAQAFDVESFNLATYPPTSWPNPVELPATAAVSSGVSTSYAGLARPDGIVAASVLPPPPDPASTVVGWEALSAPPTTLNGGALPAPRSGASLAYAPGNAAYTGGRFFPLAMYGGLDDAGKPVDPPGTLFYLDSSRNGAGWTTPQIVTSKTASPFPSTNFSFGVAAPVARSGVALSRAVNYSCSSGSCTNQYNTALVVGGVDAQGALTDKVYIFGDRTDTGTGNKWIGWWNETQEVGIKLPVPNAGMAFATNSPPIPNIATPTAAALSGIGMMMVGGQGITAGSSNDNNACQMLLLCDGNSTGCQGPTPSTLSFQTGTCTTADFATDLGGIGYRTGVALAPYPINGGGFFLFGGNRSGATTTPAQNGLQNDLWFGNVSVACNTVGTPPCASGTQVLQTSWGSLNPNIAPPTPTNPWPSPRQGASLAFGETTTRLYLFGGTDQTGPLNDLWMIDFATGTPYTWRKLSIPAGSIGPDPLATSSLVGTSSLASVYDGSTSGVVLAGGTVGATPSLGVGAWRLYREAAPRFLLKLPTGVSSPSSMQNARLSLTIYRGNAFFPRLSVYAWDGSLWRPLDQATIPISSLTVNVPAAPFVEADGTIWLLAESTQKPTSGGAVGFGAQLDAIEARLDFQ